MKKYLSIVFILSTLFICSCSTEDTFETDSKIDNEKKYAVSLNIQSPTFEIIKTPLKASFTDFQNQLQIVVYKETGELYSDSITLSEDLRPFINSDQSLSYSLQLPVGKYHVAIIYTGYTTMMTGYPNNYLKPNNYFTDVFTTYYSGMTVGPNHNRKIYYNTTDITVSPTSNNTKGPITLEPKWSTVDLTIDNIDLLEFPTDGNFVEISVLPNHSGVDIQSGIAVVENRLLTPSYIDKDYLKEEKTFSNRYNIAETNDSINDLRIRFIFKKEHEYTASTIVGTYYIPLNKKAENGQTYKITGDMRNIVGSEPNESMNISLGKFNPDDIIIEF